MTIVTILFLLSYVGVMVCGMLLKHKIARKGFRLFFVSMMTMVTIGLIIKLKI